MIFKNFRSKTTIFSFLRNYLNRSSVLFDNDVHVICPIFSIDHVVHEKNEMETALAGLTSHLARLDNQTIRYLTMRMVNETSSWLSSAFKLVAAHPSFKQQNQPFPNKVNVQPTGQ